MQTWNLKLILENFDKLYLEVSKEIEQYKTLKFNPKMSEEEFKKIVLFNENISHKLSRLSAYSSLSEAQDLSDENARLMQSKLQDLSIKLDDLKRPYNFWIMGKEEPKLDDKNAKRLFKIRPELNYKFNYSRNAVKHSLSHAEESIITRKEILSETLLDLYSQIVASFEYKFRGKKIEHQSELTQYIHSTNPKDRKEAYQTLLSQYKKNLAKFFLIYKATVKDYDQESELRKFSEPISAKNFSNHIPDSAIRTLLKVCRENKKIYHDFFKYKAKLLGMKKLRRYDLYAPTQKVEKKIKFEDAKKIVFDCFSEFDLSFFKHAKKVMNGHLDSHSRKNKRTGAFCMSVAPDIIPYVMTNFTGSPRDISTLAHELGHAVHYMYASEKLPIQVAHSNLPLAETASTFGEMLIFEKLLNEANEKEKLSMLVDKMGDSFATILRQTYFVLFEIEAHKKLKKGISESALCNLYFSNLQEQFGNSIELAEDFKYEWAYIPHIFHTPFYCYSYAFGELLSLSLYSQYKKEGKSFVPKIIKILQSGSSKAPEQILSEIGIDLNSEKFWQNGFSLIKEWMDEIKKLSSKKNKKQSEIKK